MADFMTTTPEPKIADQPVRFFRHAAARIARHSLGQVAGCRTALAEPVRIQALHILTYALQLDEQWPLARDLLLLLADKLEQSSYRDGWLPLLEHGLRLSQQYQDRKTMAELQLRIGYLLQVSGQLAAACDHYADSATAFAEIGHPERRARVLNQYAYAVRQQQQRPRSMQLLQEALTLVAEEHPERANAFFVRGWLALDDCNWQGAADDFAKAVAILEKWGTSYQLACALRDLAVPLYWLHNLEEASNALQRAAVLFGHLNNQFQQAVVKMNWCIILLTHHQPTVALSLFVEAEPVFRQLHDDENLGKLYLNQGLAYRAVGKFQHSLHLLRAAISLFEQIGNSDWLANTVDELGLTLLQMGETQQAVTTFQEALTILATAPEPSSHRHNQIVGHLQTALQSVTPTKELW